MRINIIASQLIKAFNNSTLLMLVLVVTNIVKFKILSPTIRLTNLKNC